MHRHFLITLYFLLPIDTKNEWHFETSVNYLPVDVTWRPRRIDSSASPLREPPNVALKRNVARDVMAYSSYFELSPEEMRNGLLREICNRLYLEFISISLPVEPAWRVRATNKWQICFEAWFVMICTAHPILCGW